MRSSPRHRSQRPPGYRWTRSHRGVRRAMARDVSFPLALFRRGDGGEQTETHDPHMLCLLGTVAHIGNQEVVLAGHEIVLKLLPKIETHGRGCFKGFVMESVT